MSEQPSLGEVGARASKAAFGKTASTPVGAGPVIPVAIMLIGGYLAWFGIHYWRDANVRWPSDPVKSVLQGKGIATASKQASTSAQLDALVTTAAPGGGSIPASPTVSGTAAQNKAVLQQVAASHGWTGAEWDALVYVETREAGFSLTAKNPSSGAYGEAQFINGPSEYAQYGGNSTSAFGQAVAMCNYIKQRYGTPSAAMAHEQNFGWY